MSIHFFFIRGFKAFLCSSTVKFGLKFANNYFHVSLCALRFCPENLLIEAPYSYSHEHPTWSHFAVFYIFRTITMQIDEKLGNLNPGDSKYLSRDHNPSFSYSDLFFA